MTITLRVVRDVESLAALAPTWNELLRSSASDNLFLTWEWVSTWWDVYGPGKRLHVIVASGPDGQIVGIAPLMLASIRVLGMLRAGVVRFIGDGQEVSAEYLDIITAPGYEEAVAAACVSHLCADLSCDIVDLSPLAATSRHRSVLERLLDQERGGLRSVPASTCPVFRLPPSTHEFLATRTKNYRKKFGEYERRCSRELGASVRRTETALDLERDMANLVRLHRQRWGRTTRAFRSKAYCTFHERLARRMFDCQRLRLFSLESASAPLAILYCFAYGGRYYFCQSGRDPDYGRHRVGLVLMHQVIKEAINEAASDFDFLSGEEAYKYRWATSDNHSVRLVYWKSTAGKATLALFDTGQKTARALRHLSDNSVAAAAGALSRISVVFSPSLHLPHTVVGADRSAGVTRAWRQGWMLCRHGMMWAWTAALRLVECFRDFQ